MIIDTQSLKKSLTVEQIIEIVTNLGADRHLENTDSVIFPTICHNIDSSEASMKLYYYKESFMFHCYTDCGENFDIIELIKKVTELNGREFNFYQAVDKLVDMSGGQFFSENNEERYINNATEKMRKEIELVKYDKAVLQTFSFYPTIEWLEDGITIDSMKKFGIKYYAYRNKIIIPHYDIDNELIGIRSRNLEPLEVKNYGKYTPLKIENTMYNHPLSFNLYGINFNKGDIQKYKKAIIFEGEKSVLIIDQFYDYNISVASCGSSINYRQIELLVKQLGVNEITIAYDKEFNNFMSHEADSYYNKLKKISSKYNNYCDFYFIFDFDNLLKAKDSPVDRGKDTFEKLMKTRIKVKNNEI